MITLSNVTNTIEILLQIKKYNNNKRNNNNKSINNKDNDNKNYNKS